MMQTTNVSATPTPDRVIRHPILSALSKELYEKIEARRASLSLVAPPIFDDRLDPTPLQHANTTPTQTNGEQSAVSASPVAPPARSKQNPRGLAAPPPSLINRLLDKQRVRAGGAPKPPEQIKRTTVSQNDYPDDQWDALMEPPPMDDEDFYLVSQNDQYMPSDQELDAFLSPPDQGNWLNQWGSKKGRLSAINSDLDAIPKPLGLELDGKPRRLLCGQPEWALESLWNNVPMGSFYDAWIWDAVERGIKRGGTTVELYVSPTPTQEKLLTNTTRKDGSVVAMAHTQQVAPTFSVDHHVLTHVPKSSTMPWGDAERVLLIPVSYKPIEVRVGRNRTPHTEYHPDVAAATRMLNGRDTTVHVIHGRCSLTFFDSAKNEEHFSDYWVVLPKKDLLRRHRQWEFERSQILKQTVISPGKKAFFENLETLRPNERYLGTFTGKAAKDVYEAAFNQTGVVLPSEWTPDEVASINLMHLGKQHKQIHSETQDWDKPHYIPQQLSSPSP